MRPMTRGSGNILIYILGAIFLLGILIALVKGSFQEGTGIDNDKIVLRASEAQRYASELERGVGYVLRNGVSESDIRFAHPDATVVTYGDITDTPARQIFDSAGGGVEYMETIPAGINDGTQWQFFATTHIRDMGTNTAASQRAELLAVLPNVTQAFCSQINLSNQQLIDLTLDADPSGNGCVYAPGSEFTGSFTDSSGANTVDQTKFSRLPPKEACVRCGSDGKFHYYRVLMAR